MTDGGLTITPHLLARIHGAARRVGGRTLVEHEDLVQEGWLAVLTHLRDNPNDAGDQNLLVTIGWRRMLSHIRNQRRSARYSTSPAMDAFTTEHPPADAGMDVKDALASLDERKRKHIEAQIYEGRSVADAAGEAGIAHATGQLWNHKIYKALRPRLQEAYGPDVERLRKTKRLKRRDCRSWRHAGVRRVHATPEAFQ